MTKSSQSATATHAVSSFPTYNSFHLQARAAVFRQGVATGTILLRKICYNEIVNKMTNFVVDLLSPQLLSTISESINQVKMLNYPLKMCKVCKVI